MQKIEKLQELLPLETKSIRNFVIFNIHMMSGGGEWICSDGHTRRQESAREEQSNFSNCAPVQSTYQLPLTRAEMNMIVHGPDKISVPLRVTKVTHIFFKDLCLQMIFWYDRPSRVVAKSQLSPHEVYPPLQEIAFQILVHILLQTRVQDICQCFTTLSLVSF